MKRGPEIKAPKFLSDLYRDLRDQRLLPLVIVLAVAIPAVPIVLSDPTPTFVPPADNEGLAGAVVDDSLMVVSAPAGLRRHGERFAERTPRDPFLDPNAPKSVPTSSEGDGASTPGGSASSDSGNSGDGGDISDGGSDGGSSTSPTGNGKTPGDTGGNDSPGADSKGPDEVLTIFRLKTSVRFGVAGSGLLNSFEDIDRMRGFPNRGPIAVFIGASDDASRAVFSISADAARVSGKGTCSSGQPKNCQFLTLRPGNAVNIQDARRGVVWRLAVTSIELVETDVEVGGKDSGDSKRAGQKDGDSGPAAEPLNPDVVEAASLNEVIGLYLLK